MNFFTIFLFVGFLTSAEPTIGHYMAIFRHLFFAPQNLKYSTAIIFDRNQGEVNRELFKRTYGAHGRILVDAYGKGLSKKQLQDLGSGKSIKSLALKATDNNNIYKKIEFVP